MPFKPLNENIRQCTATSKSTGRRCQNPAVHGFPVCRLHGAHKKRKATDPPRKTTSGRDSNVIRKYKNKLAKTAEELDVDLAVGLRHGFLAFEVLDGEERRDFLAAVNQMHEDFNLNKSSDFIATELVAMSMILLRRAAKNGDLKAIETHDRTLRMHLADLKATKSAREGDTMNINTTPAEWASALLKSVDEEEARERAERAGGDGALSDESKKQSYMIPPRRRKIPMKPKIGNREASSMISNATLTDSSDPRGDSRVHRRRSTHIG